MKHIYWIPVIALLIAHQDNFLWDNGEFLFGFLPVTLAYQAGISLAAGCVWFWAVKYCWPADLDADLVTVSASFSPSSPEGTSQEGNS